MSDLEGSLQLGASPGRAAAVCVLVHGRSQSPEEIHSHILARISAPGVAFILPRSPAKSWYDAKAVDPLTSLTRTQLAFSLECLGAIIKQARLDFPGLPLLLAGFSQGACLSLEYCFSGQAAPDALVALTGCRVGIETDNRPFRMPVGLPVYITGSESDPWIPVAAFSAAVLELASARALVRADVFPGRGHEVANAEARMLQTMLMDMARGSAPAMGASR